MFNNYFGNILHHYKVVGGFNVFKMHYYIEIQNSWNCFQIWSTPYKWLRSSCTIYIIFLWFHRAMVINIDKCSKINIIFTITRMHNLNFWLMQNFMFTTTKILNKILILVYIPYFLKNLYINILFNCHW